MITFSDMNKDSMILLPGQTTKGQINTSSTNEANPSEAEPSSVQPETLFSFSDHSSSDEYYSDSSFDESLFPDEDARMEELKRRLAMYKEMLARRQAGDETKHHAERNADDLTNDETLQEEELYCSRNFIERPFQTAMDEGEIHGFVYSIYLQDGSVIQGSSLNLKEWWEEHSRDYENRIAAPEQYNSENLPMDPTEEGMIPEGIDASQRPNDSSVITSDSPSSPQSHANGFLTSELHDLHKELCAKYPSAAQFTIKESRAFVAPNFPPIYMVHGSCSNMTVLPPSASVTPPPSTAEEMLPIQHQKDDMLYHRAKNPNYSPDEPSP